MYTPKLRPQKTTEDQESTSCCTLRHWLLIWGFIRFGLELIAIYIFTIQTVAEIRFIQKHDGFDYSEAEAKGYVIAGTTSLLVQFLNVGMVVTFIIAGFKKNVKLYIVYYRFCIVSLIIYVLSALLSYFLDEQYGHWFVEFYLTYHLGDLPVSDDDTMLFFGVAALIYVGLEILLIYLIRRLIKKYSYNENNTPGVVV